MISICDRVRVSTRGVGVGGVGFVGGGSGRGLERVGAGGVGRGVVLGVAGGVELGGDGGCVGGRSASRCLLFISRLP